MKKGITLVSVIATVAIVVILATTITISGISVSNSGKRMAFATELNALEQSVNTYAINNNGAYPTSNDILLDVSMLSDSAKKQFSDNGEVINSNNKIALSVINYSLINNNNLKYGKQTQGENDVYAVSAKTGKVYYAKGLKIGNNVYFGMTQELQKLIEYNSDRNSVDTVTAIVFEPSKLEWTNTDVTVSVKIPKQYVVTSVTANSTLISKTGSDASYNIYNVTQTGNYVITVKYKQTASDTEQTSKFNVNNVDKVAPTFTVSELTRLQSDDSSIVGYIKLTSKFDESSGIGKVLYENDIVDTNVQAYFSAISNDIKDDTIPVKKGVSNITVYVEDKAGNFSSKVIKINI